MIFRYLLLTIPTGGDIISAAFGDAVPLNDRNDCPFTPGWVCRHDYITKRIDKTETKLIYCVCCQLGLMRSSIMKITKPR